MKNNIKKEKTKTQDEQTEKDEKPIVFIRDSKDRFHLIKYVTPKKN